MNALKRYTLAALAAALFAGPAHAGVVGESSYSNVEVGASTVDAVDPNDPAKKRHIKGQRPGIGVATLPGGVKATVDFQTLEVYARYARSYSNGVSTLRYGPGMPSSHKDMGVFNFAKVSGADVYFGEWSKTSNVADGSHTVYYAGDDSGTTVPTSGSATYAVKGISNYGSRGLLSGTFYATFSGSSGSLEGSLSNGKSGADRYSLDIGYVNTAGAILYGSGAKATYGSNQSLNSGVVTNGVVRGRFFGANARALAGMVNFKDNRQFDTAFGGAKQ